MLTEWIAVLLCHVEGVVLTLMKVDSVTPAYGFSMASISQLRMAQL